MEYVIVGMLGVLIILQVVNLFKKKNDTEIVERLGKLELGMVKEIGEFKVSFANDIRKDFDTLVEKIDRKLTEINMRVTERLDQSLEKTNKTFANVFSFIFCFGIYSFHSIKVCIKIYLLFPYIFNMSSG